MKNPIKALLLGCVIIGMAAGCEKSTPSSSNISSASASVATSSAQTTSSAQASSSKASSSASSIKSSSVNSSSTVSSSSITSSVAPTIVDFEVVDTNVKKEYVEGEKLNLAGLIVNTVYSDGSKATTTDYTVTPANETTLIKLGTNVISVTYGNSNKSFDVTVTSAWNEEKQTAMKTALHNEVLPYVEEASFTNSETNISINAGEYAQAKFEAYVAALTANGYTYFADNDGSYVYEKTITTAAGERVITVIIITRNNELVINASDRYSYEFPVTHFTEAALYEFGSNCPIPAVNAHHYLQTSSTSIICFMPSTAEDGGYTNILKGAGWKTFEKGENEEAYHATSPDGVYEVQYLYDSDLECLSILISYLSYWNKESHAKFITKYGGESFEVPAFNKEGARYVFIDNSANAQYYANGELEKIQCAYFVLGAKTEDIPAYVEVLKAAGWNTSTVQGVCTAKLVIPEKGTAVITVSYQVQFDAVTVIINLMLDPLPITEFPTEQVEEILGIEFIDYVPEIEGYDCTYEITDNQYGSFIFVYTEENQATTVMNAYISTLNQAGYTEAGEDLDGFMRYLSPNKEILITLVPMGSELFIIEFCEAPLLAFPGDSFTATYGQEGGLIQEVDGAVYYTSQILGKFVRVEAIYKTKEQASNVLAAYKETLEDNNFEFIGNDESGDAHYSSPNKKIDVKVYTADNVFVIYTKEIAGSGWPAAKIDEYLEGDYASQIPAYNNGSEYEISFLSRTDTVYISIKVDDYEEAYYEYYNILKDAGYTTEDDVEEMDIYLYSPNDEIEINLCVDDYRGRLEIYICLN